MYYCFNPVFLLRLVYLTFPNYWAEPDCYLRAVAGALYRDLNRSAQLLLH
jgi:hypothetical protein